MNTIRTLFIAAQLGCAFGVGLAMAAWEAKPFGTPRAIRAVQFAGPDTGWAVGDSGTVLKTTNGGDSWTAQSLNRIDIPVKGVHVLDGRHAWLIAGDSYFAVTAGKYLYRTTNGGETWIHLANDSAYRLLLGSAERGDTSYYAYKFNTVNFKNRDTGWAATLLDTKSQNSNSAAFLETTDGGVTWTMLRDSRFGGLMNANQVRFHAVLNGSKLLRDYGYTVWTGSGMLGGGQHGSQYYVSYCTSDRSYDRGVTWTGYADSPSSPTCGNLAEATASHANGEKVWYASTSLQRSTDSGKTWLAGPTLPRPVRGIHFLGNLGYAVGDTGLMLRSTNAGLTWEPQRSGTSAGLSSVQLTSATSAYALLGTDSLLRGDPSVPVALKQSAPPAARFTRLEGNQIRYTLPYAARVRIALRDASGRTVQRALDRVEAPGRHVLVLPTAALAPGKYFIDFSADGRRESWPLIKNP